MMPIPQHEGAREARLDAVDGSAVETYSRSPRKHHRVRDQQLGRIIRPAKAPARRPPLRSDVRRIALVTGNFDTVADGVSRTLTRLVDHLRLRGYDVLIVGPDRIRAAPIDGLRYLAVPSVPIPGRSEYQLPLGLPRSARRTLEGFAPHIVHIATPDLLGFRSLSWARDRGVPVVSSYHTHFPTYLPYYHASILRPAMERYLAWFYSQCRHIYVPTPMLESYARRLGLDGKIRLWGRGVDCRRFSPVWRSDAWRADRGINSTDVLVTFVGRLVKEKRLDVFVHVAEQLAATGAPIRTMIVGDGPLRTDLEERLTNTLFVGHVEEEDLSRAYASSDVFLFPSDTEAFGNVIVEAMASGLPVVAAGSCGSSCHVRPEHNGLLAAAGDVDAFIRLTLRLALDRTERRRMGELGRRYAKAYDWDRTLTRIERYYDELME